MPTTTQIRGTTQVKDGSIKNQQIATDAAIATSKLEEGADFLQRDGSVALTGTLNAANQLITGLPDPVSGSDVMCKRFADNTYMQPIDVRTVINTNSPDGERMSFDLSQIPVADSEHVFLTGMIQEPGSEADYTLSGKTITFGIAPDIYSRIRVTYLYNKKFYEDIIFNSEPGGVGSMEIGSTFIIAEE